MGKERTYQRRGKPVQVQELALKAVQGGSEAADAPPLPDAVRPADADSFRQAGWRLVPAEQAAGGAKVFVKRSGGLALGTDRLTVQLPGDPDPAEAERVLAEQGVPVRQLDRLKFAPGLYQVACDLPDDKDVLDVANELTRSGAVVFAEPELMEAFSRR